MDRFIAGFDSEADLDLQLCLAEGVAYQRDMTQLVPYDAAYFNRCLGYEDQAIANAINAGRIALVAQFFGSGKLLDVGIGSGEFIKKRPNTFGHDVNPAAIEWLKRADLWAPSLEGFGAFTFWDVIEHVPEPEQYLMQVRLHAFVFVSVPVFADLRSIRASRHYRPGEHLYYWTAEGFVNWMGRHGFMLLAVDDFETAAGRDSIGSFAFKRVKWPS